MQLFPSWGFPSKVVKNPPAKAGDAGLMPGSRRSHREGNGNPLPYSCLGNPIDREAWRAMVHRVTKSQIRLSNETTTMKSNLPSTILYQICARFSRAPSWMDETKPDDLTMAMPTLPIWRMRSSINQSTERGMSKNAEASKGQCRLTLGGSILQHPPKSQLAALPFDFRHPENKVSPGAQASSNPFL